MGAAIFMRGIVKQLGFLADITGHWGIGIPMQAMNSALGRSLVGKGYGVAENGFAAAHGIAGAPLDGTLSSLVSKINPSPLIAGGMQMNTPPTNPLLTPPGARPEAKNGTPLAKNAVVPLQGDSIKNMVPFSLSGKTAGVDAVSLGNDIIKKIKESDGKLSDAVTSGLTGNRLPFKEVTNDFSLPANATEKDVDRVRTNLAQAKSQLIQGNPALSAPALALITELQNQLPMDTGNLSAALGANSPIAGPTLVGNSLLNSSSGMWIPGKAQVAGYNNIARALNDPHAAIAGLLTGQLPSSVGGSLDRVYPNLMASARGKTNASLAKMERENEGAIRSFSPSRITAVRNFMQQPLAPQSVMNAIISMPSMAIQQPQQQGNNKVRAGQISKTSLASSMAPTTSKLTTALYRGK